MDSNSKMGHFIQDFLVRTDDLNLENYEILMEVSVRLQEKYAEEEVEGLLFESLREVGMSSIDGSLMKPGVVSLPVVTGRIHPTNIPALAALETVENIEAIQLRKPLKTVKDDE